MGFLSIFKRRKASSPFEALKSTFLSSCQRDLRPPVKGRRETGAFSMVSTGDSDIPYSSEMKDEPAFKSLQESLALLRVRASRCPSHLRQKTQGPSHIAITERSLLLRCLWKVSILHVSKPGNQLSSPDDLGYTKLSSSCCADLGVPLDLGQCSLGTSGVAYMKSSHLSCLMRNARWLWSKCRGIGLHLDLIWGTWSSFVLLH